MASTTSPKTRSRIIPNTAQTFSIQSESRISIVGENISKNVFSPLFVGSIFKKRIFTPFWWVNFQKNAFSPLFDESIIKNVFSPPFHIVGSIFKKLWNTVKLDFLSYFQILWHYFFSSWISTLRNVISFKLRPKGIWRDILQAAMVWIPMQTIFTSMVWMEFILLEV